MNFRDYIEEVTIDAEQQLSENLDYYRDQYPEEDGWNFQEVWDQELYDNFWIDDAVTGNGSGSYTFSGEKAKENVAELIWDDEFINELEALDMDLGNLFKQGPEALDVTARCLALGQIDLTNLEAIWNGEEE